MIRESVLAVILATVLDNSIIETAVIGFLGMVLVLIILEAILRWFDRRFITDVITASIQTTTTVLVEAIKAGHVERSEALRTTSFLINIDYLTDYAKASKYYDMITEQIEIAGIKEKTST